MIMQVVTHCTVTLKNVLREIAFLRLTVVQSTKHTSIPLFRFITYL